MVGTGHLLMFCDVYWISMQSIVAFICLLQVGAHAHMMTKNLLWGTAQTNHLYLSSCP